MLSLLPRWRNSYRDRDHRNGTDFKGLSNQLSEFRIATATNMLGNSVLVPGTKAYPDSEGAVHGIVDLPAASGATNVVFKSIQGEILHVEDLGAQPSGLTGFEWKDIPQEVLDANEYITVEAFADHGNGLEGASASVFSEVLAASGGADGVQLDVRGYGDISASDVVRFRKGSGT